MTNTVSTTSSVHPFLNVNPMIFRATPASGVTTPATKDEDMDAIRSKSLEYLFLWLQNKANHEAPINMPL